MLNLHSSVYCFYFQQANNMAIGAGLISAEFKVSHNKIIKGIDLFLDKITVNNIAFF